MGKGTVRRGEGVIMLTSAETERVRRREFHFQFSARTCNHVIAKCQATGPIHSMTIPMNFIHPNYVLSSTPCVDEHSRYNDHIALRKTTGIDIHLCRKVVQSMETVLSLT